MTEDDAKTKWCPFARVIAPIELPGGAMVMATGNRVSMPEHLGQVTSGEPLNPPTARCIGSACMAWRWGGLRFTEYHGTHRMGKMAPAGYAPGQHERGRIDHVGHCGLASAPNPSDTPRIEGGDHER